MRPHISPVVVPVSGFVAGLLAAFLVAVLGCGSGFMPSPFTLHGEGMVCSGMFTTVFILSSRELGPIALLVLVALLIAMTAVVYCTFVRLTFVHLDYIPGFLRIRSVFLRLCHYLLQHFSAGILHPRVY